MDYSSLGLSKSHFWKSYPESSKSDQAEQSTGTNAQEAEPAAEPCTGTNVNPRMSAGVGIGTYLLGLVDEYWAMRRPWQYGSKQPQCALRNNGDQL